MPARLPACILTPPVLPAERYGERNGGYTRVKAEPYLRRGDGTEMAIIELV